MKDKNCKEIKSGIKNYSTPGTYGWDKLPLKERIRLKMEEENRHFSAWGDFFLKALELHRKYLNVKLVYNRINLTTKCYQFILSSEFLVRCGIDSISINPDAAVLTRKLVASIEQRIMLEKGSRPSQNRS